MESLLINSVDHTLSVDTLVDLLLINVRATLLLISCFIVLRIIKTAAATQHFLVFVAMASLLLLPLSSQLMPAFDFTIEVLEPIASDIIPLSGSTLISNSQSQLYTPYLYSSYLLAVYLLGSAFILLNVLRCNFRIFLITKSSDPVNQTYWQKSLLHYQKRLGIKRNIELRHSNLIASPSTWGSLNPTILLPNSALQWPDHLIESTLLHELAHIKRNDWLVQQIARCICALYWVNPMCWSALTKLCTKAETACDDSAINAGVKNTHYANNLVNVAEHALKLQKFNIATIAMAASGKPSELMQRIISILDSKGHHNPITKLQIVLTLLIFACILIPLASVRANYVEIVISDLPTEETIATSFDVILNENQNVKNDFVQHANNFLSLGNPYPLPTIPYSLAPYSLAPPDLTITLDKTPKKVVVEKVKMELSHKLSELGKSLIADAALASTRHQNNNPTHSTPSSNHPDAQNNPELALQDKTELQNNVIASTVSDNSRTNNAAKNTVLSPARKNMVIPEYPKRALYRGIEGNVTVEYNIDKYGKVSDAKIISASPNNLFSSNVLKAIRNSTFSPRTINGQSVPTIGLTEKYVFVLKS